VLETCLSTLKTGLTNLAEQVLQWLKLGRIANMVIVCIIRFIEPDGSGDTSPAGVVIFSLYSPAEHDRGGPRASPFLSCSKRGSQAGFQTQSRTFVMHHSEYFQLSGTTSL
jgi:hypothetical protein